MFVTDGVTESLEDRSEPPDATIAAIARGHFASTRAMCEAIMATSMRGTGPAGIEGWSDDRTIVAFSVAERPVEEPHPTATVTISKEVSAV